MFACLSYPVQIKSSSYSKGASDNFSSKAAILYALTTMSEGGDPESPRVAAV